MIFLTVSGGAWIAMDFPSVITNTTEWDYRTYMTLKDVNKMDLQALGKIAAKLPELFSLILDSSHLSQTFKMKS